MAGVKVNFHWAPAGTFQMGSPQSEEDCDEEPILLGCTLTKGIFTEEEKEEKVECDEDETQHEVELTYGFWIAETETTQGFWQAVMGDNPSFFRGSNLLPVDSVSWNDCQVFVDKLNNDYRDTLPNGYIFALPTEAQWEYAYRVGESTCLFNYVDSVKTCEANYNWEYMHTERVKSYCPNDWGLYDMLGNVYEWCADWYDKDYYTNATASKDPKGPCSGTTRILRGGSWLCCSRFCRSTDRFDNDPDVRPYDFGFRLVLVPDVGASQTNVADPKNGTN
ncbi:MAG: formylglycine-generating enzyme family protein [Planctomycetia bacterium]|nr:formylglycine-generating enzyme family protein [Planctomycetia bacterium]